MNHDRPNNPELDHLFRKLQEERDMLASLENMETIHGVYQDLTKRRFECHHRIQDLLSTIIWYSD